MPHPRHPRRPVMHLVAAFGALALAAALWAGAAAGAPLQAPLGVPPEQELALIERRLKADEYLEAAETARDLLARFPSSAEAHALHGLALFRSGDVAGAEAAFRSALRIDPGSPEAHLGMGRISRGWNRLDEAAAHHRKGTASKRFDGEAYLELSRVLAEQGEFAGALKAVRQASERIDYCCQRDMRASIAYYGALGPEKYLIIPEFRKTRIEIKRNQGSGESPIREVEVRLNGAGPWPFHLDTAHRGQMAISSDLARELNLPRSGRSSAGGVGPGTRVVEGSSLERLEIGEITIRKVPVTIMDSPTFRGGTKGLIGTGLLKRFNCTLDVRKGTLDLFHRDRVDLFREQIRDSRVVARVPIFHSSGPVVPVGVEGGPAEPFILDTAASATLIDDDYFEAHVEGSVDPNALARTEVFGLGGSQEAVAIPSATLSLGDATFNDVRLVVMELEHLSRGPRRHAAGILGSNLLWRYRVHLNHTESELVLESFDDPQGE